MAYETTPEIRAGLRHERRARGWDIPRMAHELREASDYPHKMPSERSLTRYIERWEDGQVRRITERYRILYARALSMSQEELFEDDPQEPPISVPTQGDVEAIRMMLNALMAADRRFGGRRIRRQADDYLSDVIEPMLRGRAPEALRRQMFGLATEFTLRVAAMHLDTDQLDQALGLLGRASSMAAESADITLTAWVLSRRGEHELHRAALTRRPERRATFVRQALAYTEGAVGVARAAPPLSRAFLMTKHALAWSLTGDRARTQRVLGNVWTAYEQADGDQEPEWMGAYEYGHLRHEEARCYVNLGMGRQAVKAAEQALAARTAARPRAFTLGVLAIGHAQTLEVEAACATAHQMLDLASHISSRRVCIRLGEVLDTLNPYENNRAVGELMKAAEPVLQGCGI
ncbi:transcriptional regulator [Actinomadura chibensis]|uniref:Transcriptional regulator n=1 Tax=Actinomadura chibensis TaxID=392828 RepID=A0A5D0NTX1_9ACTN|nr:transcriptional regulator [Actinomadura chibensis]TYB47805.1 transcriptional regulator [Actinomadura chibensis]